MTNRPAVFFDRDGTLMEEVNYCNDPAKVRAIPGAAEALARLHLAGWRNVIVTNQSGLASGKILLSEYRAVEAELNRQMGGHVEAVYFCADSSAAPGPRRKPAIGMLEEASRDLGIALTESWMVGDKDIDIQCGRAAGCRTILVRTGYGCLHLDSRPDFVADDVGRAVDIIFKNSLSCHAPQ